MENKLLITQALDERDLLVKKINSKIERIDFVDGKKRNEEKVIQQVITKEEFCKKVKTSYQQIQDLIKRYQKIDEAIITSNANTYIETSFGTYSVAVALSMRNRLRELNAMDFETILRNKMEENYDEISYNYPILLIIGSEGFGISRLLLKHADFQVKIPMVGHVNSLNASVSTGILLAYIAHSRK